METWDVFHSDRLEVERSLTTDQVRAALARGELHDDDLVRPAGTSIPWAPLSDQPALMAPPGPESEPASPPREDQPDVPPSAPPVLEAIVVGDEDSDDLIELGEDDSDWEVPTATVPPLGGPALEDGGVEELAAAGLGEHDLRMHALGGPASSASLAVLPAVTADLPGWHDESLGHEPEDEDEEAAEFTLARGASEKVEELDLAAMVDVAFQLVLFFLVTATTVVFKSLEVPKPNPDSQQESVAQGRSKTLDELENSYILVEIDPTGAARIDHEPVPLEFTALVERLRQARDTTGRKDLLLSADYDTRHRYAVLVYDAASEINLGIAIARPADRAGPPAKQGS